MLNRIDQANLNANSINKSISLKAFAIKHHFNFSVLIEFLVDHMEWLHPETDELLVENVLIYAVYYDLEDIGEPSPFYFLTDFGQQLLLGAIEDDGLPDY